MAWHRATGVGGQDAAGSDPVPIAVVADHTLFAESLVTVLRIEGYDAVWVGPENPDGRSQGVLPAVLRMRPCVALIDLDPDPAGRLDLVAPLRSAGVSVVALTSSLDRASWGRGVASGVCRVIPKHAAIADVIETLRRLRGGLTVMGQAERRDLLARWHEQTTWEKGATRRLEQLTLGEAEVLGMLMTGLQVTEIARVRAVAEGTVRTQVRAVLAKLQLTSQLAAVAFAGQAGWTAPVVPSRS